MRDVITKFAANNDGWMELWQYEALKVRPVLASACNIMRCTHTWTALCDVVGIYPSHAASLPDVLNEAQIAAILKRPSSVLHLYRIEHRRQMALWCIRKVAADVEGILTLRTYTAIADAQGLANPSTIVGAYGSWNNAMIAAGFDANGKKKAKLKVKRQNESEITMIVDDMRAAAVPANWRTHDVYMQTLEPVTEVTLYALANGLGLRHTEVRACIR